MPFRSLVSVVAGLFRSSSPEPAEPVVRTQDLNAYSNHLQAHAEYLSRQMTEMAARERNSVASGQLIWRNGSTISYREAHNYNTYYGRQWETFDSATMYGEPKQEQPPRKKIKRNLPDWW